MIDGKMLVKGYNPATGNHMGLTLGAAVTPTPNATTTTLTGTADNNYLGNPSGTGTAATINGDAGRDMIFGSGQGDIIDGGDDLLVGGKGNDHLEGGIGNDTYKYSTGDGFDTIVDTDGIGAIEINSTPLTGGNRADADGKVFKGTDALGVEHTYVFKSGDIKSGGDLVIDGKVLVKNYKAGQLGLTLNEHDQFSFTDSTATMQEGGQGRVTMAANSAFGVGDVIRIIGSGLNGLIDLMVGDVAYAQEADGSFLIPAAEGQKQMSFVVRQNGQITQNESVTFTAEVLATDANGVQSTVATSANSFTMNVADFTPPASTSVLDGTTGADYLDAYQSGTGAAATINGNAGRDEIFGSGTGDVIDGGADGDWIIGNGGADQINGGAGDDLITNVYGGSSIHAGDGNDIVAGNAYEAMTIGTTNTPVTRDAFWADLIQHWNNVGSTQFSLAANGNLYIWSGGGVPYNFNVSGNSSLGNGWTYQFSIAGGTFGAKYFHPTLALDFIGTETAFNDAANDEVHLSRAA